MIAQLNHQQQINHIQEREKKFPISKIKQVYTLQKSGVDTGEHEIINGLLEALKFNPCTDSEIIKIAYGILNNCKPPR